jgi:predicted NAD/FAD-dependent oxidoreductase
MFVESTYEAIFAEIARLPREKATIRLNERVTTGRDVEDSQVVLETKNGESLAFDEVLMTTPLGWLKRNKDTVFQPALPERMSAGIDGISVGHLEKVFSLKSIGICKL